ncbi:hypothetical protein SDC9_68706 [bioreactor metagenome]|uniref:Outer membrane protein beta-barrel domain-containing protein n=1 Tax=bioreactor metagenome TaxID=1076179 RepID=A0A644Y160_9ZZZZ
MYIRKISTFGFMKCRILFFATLFLLSLAVMAQYEPDTVFTPGWNLGINTGYYRASSNSAGYYDGRPQNENNINYVLNNYYWNQDIRRELMDVYSRDSFQLVEYPAKMKYNGAMLFGFSARYNYSADFSLNFQFNFEKLHLNDVFNLEVYPALPGDVQTFIPCMITGEEARSNIDFSMMFSFASKARSPLKPFFEIGVNLNSVNVKSSQIHIIDLTYNIRDIYNGVPYIPNTPLSEYPIKQGGIGYGLYSTVGLRYVMSKDFWVELLGMINYSTINLEGYKGFGLHYAPVLRLVMSPAMLNSEENY